MVEIGKMEIPKACQIYQTIKPEQRLFSNLRTEESKRGENEESKTDENPLGQRIDKRWYEKAV